VVVVFSEALRSACRSTVAIESRDKRAWQAPAKTAPATNEQCSKQVKI